MQGNGGASASREYTRQKHAQGHHYAVGARRELIDMGRAKPVH